jgi:hypothetical protein
MVRVPARISRAAHETSHERAGYNSNSSRNISETSQLVMISDHELKPVTRARLVLVELARRIAAANDLVIV